MAEKSVRTESAQSQNVAAVTQQGNFQNLLRLKVEACAPRLKFGTKEQEETPSGEKLYDVVYLAEENTKIAGKEFPHFIPTRIKSLITLEVGTHLCECQVFSYISQAAYIDQKTGKSVPAKSDLSFRITKKVG